MESLGMWSLPPHQGLPRARVWLSYLQSWTSGQCPGCCWVGSEPVSCPWGHEQGVSPGCSSCPPLPHRNFTLKSMPLPMSDVAQAYRSHPERTEEAVHKVGKWAVEPRARCHHHCSWPLPLQLQSCLTRNQLRQTLPAQTLRLQQGILTTSSEQV